MRLEARLARLEQQQPGTLSATVRHWLGWHVTDAELAADRPAGTADASVLSAGGPECLGL